VVEVAALVGGCLLATANPAHAQGSTSAAVD